MTPKEIVEIWVKAFDAGNVENIGNLYAENAINHQMPNSAVHGKEAIGNMFRSGFSAAPDMHCIKEQIVSEGNREVLEWRDPKSFRGCGFFLMKNSLIQIQHGYFGIN